MPFWFDMHYVCVHGYIASLVVRQHFCCLLHVAHIRPIIVILCCDTVFAVLRAHAVRRIRCTPESVSTTPLICPTASANVASSNGFCIWPRPKKSRSPPFCALPQSLSLAACAVRATQVARREENCQCEMHMRIESHSRAVSARTSSAKLAPATICA